MLVADDAFAQLLGPSMPLILGAMAVGTLTVWADATARRWSRSSSPKILVVFLLGHQFAFLGLVELFSALLVTAAGFAAAGFAAAGFAAAGFAAAGFAAITVGSPPHPRHGKTPADEVVALMNRAEGGCRA